MPRRISRREVRELLDGKERLLKEETGLGLSYTRFLHDWEQYTKIHRSSQKAQESHNYTVFGASFQE